MDYNKEKEKFQCLYDYFLDIIEFSVCCDLFFNIVLIQENRRLFYYY